MSDPSVCLQEAVVDVLEADSGLKKLVGDRIFDEPLPRARFPYITLGDGQVIGDDSDGCGEASEVFLQIHGWSQAVGFTEVKKITAAVRAAMKTPLALDGFTVTVTQFQQVQFLRDPDGKTRHAAIDYRFLISHTS